MLINRKRPAKLLLILLEYLGFSFLCGFISLLFLKWSGRVITANYALAIGENITMATDYWINMISILASILIGTFILMVLVQQKFAYMITISTTVLHMESGDLSKRIPIEGNDELTDLATSINCLAQTVEEAFQNSEEIKKAHFDTVATLSHDIRTPLTSVMSYLQFIQDGQYDHPDQLKLYASKAYEKAYRIKQMTDNLFETCLSVGENPQPLEKVEGNNFLQQALFEIEDMLMESGFVTSLSPFTSSMNFFLMIDKSAMPRIFDNMISNIEKYADPQYPINIYTEISQQMLVFRQSNTILAPSPQKEIESHLLGLKGTEKNIQQMGGNLSVIESGNLFTLEIKLPIY